MKKNPSKSRFTFLAFMAIPAMIIGVIMGLILYKWEVIDGAMSGLQILIVPAAGLMITVPVVTVLSVIALMRKEPKSQLTLLLLIPAGALTIKMMMVVLAGEN